MSDNNKIYEKKARLYPVIIAMLIPLILFLIIGASLSSAYLKLHHIWNIVISIIPASLITAALGYGVKLVTRSTSKKLFQFPLFREDETKMPSTEYLLWSTNFASKQKKQLIRDKINRVIGLKLMNEEQELEDENEARLLIVDAVTQIREKTRDNVILFNYLCAFGFLRNFLGANVWAFIITFIFMLINFWSQTIDCRISIGAVLIVTILFPIFHMYLKQTGREYARQLYTAFLEI